MTVNEFGLDAEGEVDFYFKGPLVRKRNAKIEMAMSPVAMRLHIRPMRNLAQEEADLTEDKDPTLFNRRLIMAGALASLTLGATASAKQGRPASKRAVAISLSGVDTVKLVRPSKNVNLKLTEGGIAQYGTWTVDTATSNSSLKDDHGFWENWILGSPGGRSNVRIYAPDKTKFLVLKNYTAENSTGNAEFILEDLGGDFGGDPAQWFRS